MLTSILPGLREVRAPLTAGILLLSTLLVGLSTLDWSETAWSRAGPGLLALESMIGDHGKWVAASVLAYLLGSLYMTARDKVVRALSARLIQGRLTNREYLFESDQGKLFFLSPFSRPSLRRIGILEGRYDSETARVRALDIIFSAGNPLLVGHEKLYLEYDRLRSEAEFRDAAAIPGFLLSIVAAIDFDIPMAAQALFVIATGSVAGLLLVQGRTLHRNANSTFAHAVADGLASLPQWAGRRASEQFEGRDKE